MGIYIDDQANKRDLFQVCSIQVLLILERINSKRKIFGGLLMRIVVRLERGLAEYIGKSTSTQISILNLLSEEAKTIKQEKRGYTRN